MFTITTMRDARVVAQVLAGQRNQFDILVERYLPAVYAVSYARLHNHFDAEDATQETFLSAFRSLHQLREPKKFEVWLVGIARRTATKMWDKRKREAESGVAEAKSHIDAPNVAQEELRHLLRREIEQLDYDAREILLLHYFAGKRTGEIAVSLDISREAAKKRLQRARQSLGERMLGHLGDDSQPASGFQKQRRAIMGLVGAAALGWGDGASAATPLAANGSAKVMVIAAAALVAGVGVFLALQPNDYESEVSPSEAPVAEVVSPSEFVLPPEVVAESEPDAAPAPAVVAGSIGDSDVGGNSLAGLWRVCDSLGMLADMPIIRVDQSGADLELRQYRADGSGSTLASGMVEDGQLRFTVEGGEVSELTGVVQDEDAFMLSGMVLEGDPPTAIEMTLTRTTERDLAEIEIQEQRTAELEEIARAIEAFAADNDKANPETLAMLVPQYLKKAQVIESVPSRRIRYVPDGSWSLDTTKTYPESTTHAEQLMLQESDRRAEWPAFPTMEPVLTVTYSAPSMTLVYRSSHHPRILRIDKDSPMKCAPPKNEMSAAQQSAVRASCQNNLKQLGIVLKMFAKKDGEDRFPAGWASTVPDYMVDTMILTCPGLQEEDVPGRTVSYTLLIPAISEEELLEVSSHLGNEAEDDAQRLAGIPLVTEVHECAQSGGSHVLFADGHVEWLSAEDWEARIGPYADYAATRVANR